MWSYFSCLWQWDWLLTIGIYSLILYCGQSSEWLSLSVLSMAACTVVQAVITRMRGRTCNIWTVTIRGAVYNKVPHFGLSTCNNVKTQQFYISKHFINLDLWNDKTAVDKCCNATSYTSTAIFRSDAEFCQMLFLDQCESIWPPFSRRLLLGRSNVGIATNAIKRKLRNYAYRLRYALVIL